MIITFQMTREYAKNREEYFREFHSVVAPVVVLDGYEYERKYDEEPSFCLHPDESVSYTHLTLPTTPYV